MSLREFQHRVLPIKDKLFRFALRMVGNSPEAEDIVQEVFIKLWSSREALAEVQNMEAWGIRITKNLAIDKLREKFRHTAEISDALPLADTEAGPYERTEQNDTLAQIQQFIDQLPEKQRLVMQLRDIEGMSYQEIAEALELPMPQVKAYLHRARQAVRSGLLNASVLR